MRSVRYKYILNGILFGATVGAGFAALRRRGYALNDGPAAGFAAEFTGGASDPDSGDGRRALRSMLQLLLLRGIEAPLGHVAWTALAAGAFWRVKEDRPTSPAMLLDPRFLKAFADSGPDACDLGCALALPFSREPDLDGIDYVVCACSGWCSRG